MKKTIIIPIIVFLLAVVSVNCNAQAINFLEGKSWDEAVNLAKQENKLIFVDVFTDWCGPCLMMEETAFNVPSVYSFYNSSFVNFRIDAEKGEGIEFKKKYKVNSYPTYLFIDPVTLEAVHRSSSRQDPEVFIFTGKSALSPDTRSFNLEKKYASGDRDPLFLKQYTAFLSSCYQTEKLNEIVDSWFSRSNVDFTSEQSMEFLEKYVKNAEHVAFQKLLANRAKYNSTFGKDRVDAKLYAIYNSSLTNLLMNGIYNNERFAKGKFDSLNTQFKNISFAGKECISKKVQILDLLRKKSYGEAAALANELPSDSSFSEKEIIDFYSVLSSLAERVIDDKDWLKSALSYSQYIAYNDPDRNNYEIHFNYAMLLEKAIKQSSVASEFAPASITGTPKYGKKSYSLRSSKLKAKPKK